MKIMRKYIRNIIVGIAALSGLVSCEDFLTKVPPTSLSSGTMFTTVTTAESVLTGAYSSLRYGHSTMWATNLDCFTEILDPDVSKLGTSYMHLTGAATTRDAMYNNVWQNHYEGIYRANDVINNFHQVPEMTEEKRAELVKGWEKAVSRVMGWAK